MAAPSVAKALTAVSRRPHTPTSRTRCDRFEHGTSACDHFFGACDAHSCSRSSPSRATRSRLRALAHVRTRRVIRLTHVASALRLVAVGRRHSRLADGIHDAVIVSSQQGNAARATTGVGHPSRAARRPGAAANQGGGRGRTPGAEPASAERKDALVRARAGVGGAASRRGRRARARRVRRIQARGDAQSARSSTDRRRLAGAQPPDGRRGVGDLGTARAGCRVHRLHRHRRRAHRRHHG